MRDFLLIVHVLAAAAWLGGGLLNGFVGPRMAKAGGPAAIAWIGALIDAVTRFFVPAGLLTALAGVLLVIVDDAYQWSDTFVGIGLGVVTVGLVIAFYVLRPAAKAALAAAGAGDFAGAATNGQKAARWGRVLVSLLILTEVAMVLRLGAA